ncbi:KUP system potassium uptake protein [Rhodanobacter glycinis]|uniref:Probable potassium transport system protein Kup n=2 Tax=Rhodanobacter glycinis TaxID=582702 RepID=A0A1I4F782_9GAMM|nr:KUP system potassium uptake protein [Rhodanobacter glycinis]
MEAEKPKEDDGSGSDEKPALPKLLLGAIGVVFGDIATSPLYSMQQAFSKGGIAPRHDNILGLLSLVFWALVLVVSIKYVVFVMRADNHGEGGMMALTALARNAVRKNSRACWWVVMLGLAGAALFFGDSVITPAISVLSAVEGLKLASPAFGQWVLPIGATIIVLLFALQKRGSSLVGSLFGPVMTLWLLSVAALGVYSLLRHPEVVAAANPRWAVEYMAHNGFKGFASLGAVVLVMTGGEALYADIGHFGSFPIRLSWFGLALPALLLNYAGQGAELLQDSSGAQHPFFSLVPHVLLYPMIVLATAATVIASQAVISGTFSMVRQGIQLGYLPRSRVEHTSGDMEGQIYLPTVNFLLFVAVMIAVLGFRSSDKLAGAYGIAVSGTMLLTTLLLLVVARMRWQWGWARLLAFGIVYVFIDASFFGANTLKLANGGWFPITLAIVMMVVMTVWRRGRHLMERQLHAEGEKLEDFIDHQQDDPPLQAPGTAVFLTGDGQWVPQALRHNVEHNHVLHERNVVLTVDGLDQPRTRGDERSELEELAHGFWRVTLRFGFAESIDVPARLRQLKLDPTLEADKVVWFIGHDEVKADDDKSYHMARWRARLFAYMARNATPATTYYGIPPRRLIEIGARIDL